MTGTDVHAHARLWLRRMLQVRRFEEQLILLYDAGEVAGHYHVCIGQEGTAVGVLAHAGPDDVVYTTHRNHGHLLLRGADPERLFAEILGRATGYSRGRSGTLHLSAPELGVPWSSALVGGNVPQAIGAAYALARLRPGSIVVCFFGDGTFEEGAVFEALNTAAVLALPILFVCENNGFAATTRTTALSAGDGPSARARSLGIETVDVDGNDVRQVDETAARLVAAIRAGGGPRFLHVRTYRLTGHTASDPAAYRPQSEVDQRLEDEPIGRLRAHLLQQAGITAAALEQSVDEIRAAVEAAYADARDAPYPEAASAFEDVQDVGDPRQEAY